MDDPGFSGFLQQWITAHKGEIRDALMEVVSIESVGAEGTPGKPFGEKVDEALRWYENKAKSFGMRTKNVDGYAVHAEIGSGDEMVAVLTHVDVVPIGSGWTRNPLGELADEKIFGRGSEDNKGPTVASLYAIRAVKESGAALKRRVRHVVGGNEESGFKCVHHYFSVEEKPVCGFSPDSAFPLVYGEKGSMTISAGFNVGESEAGKKPYAVIDISGGERANMVPDYATGVISVADGSEQRAIDTMKRSIETVSQEVGGPGPLTFEFQVEPGTVSATARGRACHSSVPQDGTNAIRGLLLLLSSLGNALKDKEKFKFLADAGCIDGAGLNIEAEDDISEKLTCNLGIISKTGNRVRAVYNIRYPVKIDGNELAKRAGKCSVPKGVEVTVEKFSRTHYTDPNSFIGITLLDVYRTETGDNSPPITMGAVLTPGLSLEVLHMARFCPVLLPWRTSPMNLWI